MTNNKKDLDRILKQQVVREAILYERVGDSKVRCGLCERRCVIASGARGFCKTRINIEGRLFILVYGNLSAIESRPIEIKPLYHYWPGSTALTFSTWSCNFNCPWCQNYHLSRRIPDPEVDDYTSPDDIVNLAILRGDHGLCASFQEPTLLTDWALDAFRKGRARGLYSCFVTNGYLTPEALMLLREAGLTGAKIDVKGDKEVYRKFCGNVDINKVWRNVRLAIELGVHVEIVNLLVTGVNDDEFSIRSLIEEHIKNAGPETPLHFTRYFPAYKYKEPPTDLSVMYNAYEIARDAGIEYVYLGNISESTYENTVCPECGAVLIKRSYYRVIKGELSRDHRCMRCGKVVPIIGKVVER
ncbi:MAG: AmmeMemoRadiSam system radical SAM enzyme [Methanomassiliicoccales archaeon]|jgi:pyruvate formate lyase activating enzyme|nr:AmmeMemoRadiSam system radical SAM enzyme [Methanomassiliicoccales archaeon]